MMSFRFYTNMLSQATRTMASGILVIGLLLIGFGVTILAFPEVFAYLAATVFFIAGFGCALMGAKIFWVQRRLERLNADQNETGVYRQNVRIHTGEPWDD